MLPRILFYICRTCSFLAAAGFFVFVGWLAYVMMWENLKELCITFGVILFFILAIVGTFWDGPDAVKPDYSVWDDENAC